MTHRFDLNEMLDTLWNMGMDDDPIAGGWLNAELEARDGQLCDVLEWSGHGPDTVALVRWSSPKPISIVGQRIRSGRISTPRSAASRRLRCSDSDPISPTRIGWRNFATRCPQLRAIRGGIEVEASTASRSSRVSRVPGASDVMSAAPGPEVPRRSERAAP